MITLFHRWVFVTAIFSFASFVFAQTEVISDPIVTQAVKMGISQPMRDIPKSSGIEKSIWKDGIIPLRSPFKNKVVDVEKDGSLKEFQGPLSISAITQNFDGVPVDPSYSVAPPDPSGDVGPNHYVQMVNLRTQIWDKNGTSLAGPFNSNQFWLSLGPPYSTSNDGDPIVLYDEMANRWMVSQFALPNGANGPCYILVAVSTTADPTGTYYQYAFTFPKMPDYPKYGVWSDGYYMSANVFSSTSYLGTYAAVFDRNQMLTGGAATMQYFSFGTSTWSFLPSDCDGAAPPVGAPNYFLATYNGTGGGNTDLDVYQFHVDWVTPANSTFTGPLLLTTPSFSEPNSIPQLGTSNTLDNLADRPMNRLQYRNFGGHQAMVVCQTVNAGSGRAGMRWWELRKTTGNWLIYQEGTHAPADGLYRWMGSIAMDANGTIALGYSTSGSTIRPDIRYTGRSSSDPLGVMTFAEAVIYAGGGVQTGTLARWGDYTQMTVDPSVSGTFWYTNEYIPTSGTFNWRTRIAAFSFVQAPSINYVSSVVSGGNGNSKIDFNECNNLSITLNNTGTLNASNVSATLSSSTPGVTVTQSVSSYPNLNVSSSGVNNTAYTFSTSPSFICGTNISFTLNVTYSGGSKIINFSLPSGSLGSPLQFDNNIVTAIPDNNPAGVDVPVVVSGITSSVAEVTVSMYITHTYDGDLTIQLISPDNTTITLASGVGSSGNDFGSNCSPQTSRTTFDDSAVTLISSGTAPFVGTYKPSGLLSTFNGKTGAAANGTWKLHVIDNANIDVGSVQCFSLFVSQVSCVDGGGECPVATNIGITVIPEGFYDVGMNRLNMKDTVNVYLRNISSPYAKVDSAKAVIDSLTFTANFSFLNVATGTYYLALNHRNSIETWSKPAGESIVKGSPFNYDFTTAQNKAYGNNMKLKGTKWCIFSGDVNQDGLVDLSDLSLVDNDNLNFQTGYRVTDLNGDLLIDLSDLQIVDTNNLNFVSKVTP